MNKSNTESITKGVRQYYPVSDSSLEVLFNCMKKMELPKKHLLIHGGVLGRHVYLVEKEFYRSYCLRDGEEIAIWFLHGGDITFAMKDLYHNQPGYEYVELLEDCELYAIRIKDLNQIHETSVKIANWGRIIHQECLLYIDIHRVNRLYFPAKERYEQLLHEQPDVIHRVQLGYITSLLGVTPQHLSRLRSES